MEFIEGENNSNIDWEQVRINAAIAAMQGILSNSSNDDTVEHYVNVSVKLADALIEELKKSPINNK